MKYPIQPNGFRFRQTRWERICEILHELASQPAASRYEVLRTIANRHDIRADSRSMRAPVQDLVQLGLVEVQTYRVVWTYSLALLRLTEQGQALCRSFGWQVCESEWERLIRLHDGEHQTRHTAAVLAVSLNARLRGWQTYVVPNTKHTRFYPDLLIKKGNQRLYVEVELGSRKQEKWELHQRIQGFVALCAKTPASRDSLIRECQKLGIGGLATDLYTLVEQRHEPGSFLWYEEWGLTQTFDEINLCWSNHELN
jgi:hypothetical protein